MDYKENIVELLNIYLERNKEVLAEKARIRQKKYYAEHYDEIRAKQKEYYRRRKEQLCQKNQEEDGRNE